MQLLHVLTFLCAAGLPLAAQDPTQGEVPLPATADWHAFVAHQSDGGIWYVRAAQWLPQYGCPEILACDDKGRLTVLVSYSGKWTPHSVIPDNQWLALSDVAEVDPRIPGPEVYVAGRAGNVHRIHVVPRPAGKFALETTEIAHLPGEEVHTLVAADLRPRAGGAELLVFAISGAVHELVPGNGDGGFSSRRIGDVGGRVRDAVTIPGRAGLPSRLAVVARSGLLALAELDADALRIEPVAQEPMGLGRVARRPPRDGQPEVLYATRDDGVVLRFEQQPGGRWLREVVYAGPQGPRGIAAGRFHEDPARESLAVFGYSRRLQLISRTPGQPWRVETIHTNTEQGHWLAMAEVDGRNGTDELIGSTFGGQVVLLSRPPGYGLRGVAVEEAEPAGADPAKPGTPARPWRIAAKAGDIATTELSPLNYQGGFETKSLIYETLVRRDAAGRIAPQLAASWQLSPDGCTWTFQLRPDARFHDGRAVTAPDVAVHFRRWVGLPEHSWLSSNERIRSVEALGAHELRITLDRPHALLPDLCAINPCAIRGPGALDREGAFRRPIGSGPFRFVEVREGGAVLRYELADPAPAPKALLDLVRIDIDGGADPLDALLRGDVDVVLSSWLVPVDPVRAAALRGDARFRVVEAPGSSMRILRLRCTDGPTSDVTLRRRIAACIDRAGLVRDVEHGFADPSTGWAAPSVRIWPQGTPPQAPTPGAAPAQPLRFALPGPARGLRRLAQAVAAQLTAGGIPVELVASEPRARGDATAEGPPPDLWLEATHGVPYDPHTTIVSRFLPRPAATTAERAQFVPLDARLHELIAAAVAIPDEQAREAVYAQIQQRLDEAALLVPLYAPRRIGVLVASAPEPVWDHDLYRFDPSWLVEQAPAGNR